MATLTGKLVADTYKALLKLIDNDVVTATEKQVSDGYGGGTGLFIDQNGFIRASKFKVTGANSSQFLKGDGSLDSTSYLSIASASSTYLTIASASSTYLTISNAASTYLPIGSTTSAIAEGSRLYFTQPRVLATPLTGFVSTSGTVTSSDTVLTSIEKIWWNIVNGGGGGGGGYVPYVGATQNLNLGTYGLISDFIQLNTTNSAIPTSVGVMSWNNTDGTADLKLKGGNVTLQIGQEQVARVVNGSGASMLESNYQVVKIIGAQGQRLQVGLAQADNDANSKDTIGLVTETIANNQEGFVTVSGLVNEIDTTGDLQGETWADGDTLYLSGTWAGALTNVKPQAPTHTVIVGFVVYAHQNHGKIFVKVDNGYELDELHNVQITSVADKNILVYDSTLMVWQNQNIFGTQGYLPFYDNNLLMKDSVIYTNGTNVGIGSTTLTEKLVVNGNILASQFKRVGGLSTQFLKADGSIDSTQYQPYSADLTAIDALALTTGLLRKNGTDTWELDQIEYISLAFATSTYQTYANLSSNLTASATKYPSVNAVNSGLALKLNLTGGTLTGDLILDYSYPKIALSDISSGTIWNIQNDGSTFELNYGATNKFYIFSSGNAAFSNDLTANKLIKAGGLSTEFLKADGSVDSTNYQPYDADLAAIAALALTTGLLRKNGMNTWELDQTEYLSFATANSTFQTLANLSSNLNASSTKYPSVNAVNTGLNSRLALTGGSLSGDLAISSSIPTLQLSDTSSGTIWNIQNDGGGFEINSGITNKFVMYSSGNATFVNDLTANKFIKSGGTSAQFLMADGSVSSGNSGTVTSVALSAPTGFSVGGSPVTSSGTLALSFALGYSLPSDATQATWTAKQNALNGTGFVKIVGTTISYDNNSYYLASNPAGYTNNLGTVTSVAMSVPTGLSISGSPITTSGTLALSLSAGYSIPTTSSQGTWDTAYNRSLTSIGVSGTTTKTLTLTKQDGTTLTASWSDINTDAVTSVFGRTGAIVATSGDYTTAQVTESGNLYYLDSRARASISGGTGISYNSTTGVITNTITQYTDALARASISGGTGISYNSTSGVITNTITQYTDALARASLSFVAGSGAYNSTTGVITIPTNTSQLTNGAGYITGITSLMVTNALGYTPVTNARQLTINGTTYDLSADRSWTISGTIGGLTSGFIPKATSASTLGNSLIFDNGTNVGIGTTTPNQNLEVKGSSSGVLRLSSTSYSYNIFTNNSDGGFYIRDVNNTANRFIISSTGNLGLGVTPSAWHSNFKALQIGVYAGLSDNSGGGGGYALFGNSYEYSVGAYKYLQNYYATLYRTYAGQHQWFNAPSGTAGDTITFTQAMTLNASGRLGIGTTSPTYKLDVVGTSGTEIIARFTASGTDIDSQINLAPTGVARGIINATANGLAFAVAGSTKAVITASGNLGLGVTPSAWSGYTALQNTGGSLIGANGELQLWQNAFYNGTSSIYVATATATRYAMVSGQHRWFNAASGTAGTAITWTQAMTLTNGGNLLVGTTTDAGYKLDVNGTGRFSGALTVTDSQTITASGTSTLDFIRTGSLTNPAAKINFKTSQGTVRWQIGTNQSTGVGFEINEADATTNRFYIAPGGAATFSSSVTAGGAIYQQYLSATKSATYLDASRYTIQTVANYDIAFEPATVERMRITTAGNVGIGTTSPTGKLEIRGNRSATKDLLLNLSKFDYGASNFYQNYSNTFFTNGKSLEIEVEALPMFQLAVNNAGTQGRVIFPNGNVGIGTTSPTGKLQSNTASTYNSTSPSGAIIVSNLSTGNGILDIGVDSSYLGYIQSRNLLNTTTYSLLLNPIGGNVGIGTTTPASLLTVNGDVRLLAGGSLNLNRPDNGAAGSILLNSSNNIVITSSLGGTMSLGTGATFSSSVTATSFIKTGGTSSQYLMADGSVTTSSGGVGGSGTTNYISKWNGTTSLANSQIFDNGTQVTVGSNVAMYKFAVNPVSNSYFGIGFTGTNQIFVNAVDSGFTAVPIVNNALSHTWLIGFGDAMLLNNSGNLLLGTTTGISGGGKLQVNGDVNINGNFKINGTVIGGGGGSGITGSGTTNMIAKWTGGTSLGDSALYDNGAYSIGIGTTSVSFPTDRKGLVVRPNGANSGEILLQNSGNTNGSTDGFAIANINGDGVALYNRINAHIRFGTNNTERLRITEDGNLGFGTTSQFGGGVKVIGIANSTTIPNTTPSGGGVLFVQNGALKYMGSNGTYTTIANA
jgi:hypothetical protein